MKHACIALMLVLCFAGFAFAQAPEDHFYQVRYLVNVNKTESNIRIVNTGANGATLTPGGTPVGDICANLYAFAPNGVLTACCTCQVPSNGLTSVQIAQSLVPLGTQLPSALVLKLIASQTNAGPCAGPASPGLSGNPIVSGVLAWTTQALPGSPNQLSEGAFIPSTLSAGELSAATGQCATLNTPPFCRSCPR